MRRCNTEACQIKAGQVSRFNLNLPIAQILYNPRREWNTVTGNVRTASENDGKVDWKRYGTDKYLLSHATIVSSVQTEDNGYHIKPACSGLVNTNGNAWDDPVLMATFKTFIGGDNFLEHCFPEEVRVLISDGTYRRICDIREGDCVINRLGVPDKVKNVQVRKANSLVNLNSRSILSRNLRVTGNHPFYVYHAREDCPITGKNNKPPYRRLRFSKSWTGRKKGVRSPVEKSGMTPKWVNAGDLDIERDGVTRPLCSTIVQKCDDINMNLAMLIGWFLAEGHFTYKNKFTDYEDGICFSLNIDEYNYAVAIKDALIKEFGNSFRSDCDVRIREVENKKSQKWLCVELCNRKAAKYFLRWCGKYSWGKVLPDIAMYIDHKIQAEIMKFYILGDGCCKSEGRGIRIGTKSERLAQQILFISNRLGLDPLYDERGILARYSKLVRRNGYDIVYEDPSTGKKSRPDFIVNFTTFDSLRFCEISGLNNCDFLSQKCCRETEIFEDDGGRWFVGRILDKKTEDWSGLVYNLEVESDNSYVAEGVVVHNCQIPSESKGRVLDAVARPVHYVDEETGLSEDVHYIDILVATDRKHTDLVAGIESGETDALSMGCTARYITCSQCGRVFGDEEMDMDVSCVHLNSNMGGTFVDENGIVRKCAELVGRTIKDENGNIVGDPESLEFIEASWVKNPAFKGAVLNHFVSDVQGDNKIVGFEGGNNLMANVFNLRVADRDGALTLRVARQEILRQRREGLIARVARGIV